MCTGCRGSEGSGLGLGMKGVMIRDREREREPCLERRAFGHGLIEGCFNAVRG